MKTKSVRKLLVPIVKRHMTALAQQQREARREVPFADERTLNLVFTGGRGEQ